MRAKQYKYTFEDIADAVNEPVRTVRRSAALGKFRPESLVSVALYVSAKRLAQESATQ